LNTSISNCERLQNFTGWYHTEKTIIKISRSWGICCVLYKGIMKQDLHAFYPKKCSTTYFNQSVQNNRSIKEINFYFVVVSYAASQLAIAKYLLIMWYDLNFYMHLLNIKCCCFYDKTLYINLPFLSVQLYAMFLKHVHAQKQYSIVVYFHFKEMVKPLTFCNLLSVCEWLLP